MAFIKKLLFPLVLMMTVVGGAVAADFIRSGDTAKGESHGESKDSSHDRKGDKAKKDSHGKSDSKDAKKKKDSKGKSKDDGHDGSDSSSVSYLKFKRQFVVPVMEHGKIEALVIMNLNLELNENAPDNVYSLEPKLRDAITRELLTMSDNNIFGKKLTSAESYETLRDTLMRASEAVVPDGIKDVLILDIARQEQ